MAPYRSLESSAIVLNGQGLLPRGKILQITDIATEHNSPYICITESHLNQNILDAEISIPGFAVYRSDRRYRSHGGVVTWLRSDLAVMKEHKFSNGVCDTLSLYIPSLSLVLINFYRPPDTSLAEFTEAIEDISNFIRHIEEREGTASPTVTLLGDFNFPFLSDWSEMGLESFSSKIANQEIDEKTVAEKKKQASLLIKFVETHFMTQYIKETTRKDNILDLFFTNDPLLVIQVRQMINTKLSDHNTILISLSYGMKEFEDEKVNHASTDIPDYDLRNGDREDWLRFNMLIQDINWEKEFKDRNVNEMSEILLKTCEDNVRKIFKKKDEKDHSSSSSSSPVTPSSCSSSSSSEAPASLSSPQAAEPSPADPKSQDNAQCGKHRKKFKSKNKIPRVIRIIFRQKRKAAIGIFSTKSANKCLALRRKVQHIEEKLDSYYSDRRNKMEDKAISQIKNNPKAFYAYAKRFQKTFSGVGPIINTKGEIITDPAKIAEEQKVQYEKVFSKPMLDKKVTDPKEFFKIDESTKIGNIHFDYMDVRDAIDQLSLNASAGPDGVPAILLKEARDNLSEPLTLIWTKSLKTGDIPEIFKMAFITPVLKPGAPKSETASYRPVSLT